MDARIFYLIPALPLLAAAIIGLFGPKLLRGSSWMPAVLAMAGAFSLAIRLLNNLDPAFTTTPSLFTWISAGRLNVPVGIYIDSLTAIYLAFITGIGLLIFIYATGYMKGDYSFPRFFAYLCLFVFFMTVLVMGNNFVMLYLGWEGVGLASYLLIGYYYPRPAAVAAAKKAFIVNRVGDFGFAVGIFLIYKTFGTLNFFDVFQQMETFVRSGHPAAGLAPLNVTALHWIPFLLMIGAFGKSAQFPLHVWLPDAMEGPTPVSALIHAATMVTAGVYLVARAMPFFSYTPASLEVVGFVGALTAFMAASIALCQYDLKRILAYSTLSQLGYMFMALGVAAGTSAVFHVFTHAFFKALLFLGAGSVMHAMGGELDIRRMSGIRRYMPVTFVTFLIGSLALAGFPGLSGFFSKDEIIAAAFNSPRAYGPVLGVVGLVVAFMTAYYTFRLFFRVFTGPELLPATAGHHEPSPFEIVEDSHQTAHTPAVPAVTQDVAHAEASSGAGPHGHDEHGTHAPSDGSAAMWFPLIILAIGAIGAGYLGVELHGAARPDWLHTFLGDRGAESLADERVSHQTMMIISSVIALVGIAVAFYFHKANRHAATIVGSTFRPVVKFLENKWYIDEFYHQAIVRPLWVIAKVLDVVDRFVIDGAVFCVGFLPQLAGYTIKPLQSGRLQYYGLGMIAGVAVITLWVLMLLW